MLVLDMIFVDWIVEMEKFYKYLEMYFSCFGPFGVWGVTVYALNKVAIHALHVIMHYFCILVI